jgi:hypothetical protein
MEKRLYLTFIDTDNKTIKVPVKTRNHAIADLWYKMLKDFVQDKKGYIETRWSGFQLKRTSLPILISKLQRCVDGINQSWLNTEFGYKIEIDKIPEDYPVTVHNIIHHHFEILMGQTWKPSIWYHRVLRYKKDEKVFKFIRGLNDISHEIEEYKGSDRFPHLHTMFAGQNHSTIKVDLPQEAENYFELGHKEGAVYLQYCQLGKTWPEVIYDEDDEIFEENISPLRFISGEFSISFKGCGESHEQLLQELIPKLVEYGKDPTDKSLRLGRLPVADLEYDSIPNLINLIEGGYDQLHSIEMDGIVKIIPPYLDKY